MGEIVEDIPLEDSCSGICLSKDWVDYSVTEMNIHGCTMLAYIGEALFDIHAL